MAQLVRVFAAKPDELSSNHGNFIGGEENGSCTLSSNVPICAVASNACVCTCTQSIKRNLHAS